MLPLSCADSRLLDRISESFSVMGDDHFVSGSIGIVTFPDDGDSVETLLKSLGAKLDKLGGKPASRSSSESAAKSVMSFNTTYQNTVPNT